MVARTPPNHHISHMRYRSIPVYVEADSWAPGEQIPGVEQTGHGAAILHTPAGPVALRVGDFVVTHDDGRREVVSGADFHRLFVAAREPIAWRGLDGVWDDDA